MNAKTIMTIIGAILAGIAVLKMSIIGYYPSEAPLFIGIAIVGAVCLFVAQKIPTKKP